MNKPLASLTVEPNLTIGQQQTLAALLREWVADFEVHGTRGTSLTTFFDRPKAAPQPNYVDRTSPNYRGPGDGKGE